MGGFPILSAMTFLPLAGALIIMLVRAATAGSREASSGDSEGRTALLAALPAEDLVRPEFTPEVVQDRGARKG